MNLRTLIKEVFYAFLVVIAWVAGCYAVASVTQSTRMEWWNTAAWSVWWIGILVGAAYAMAGALTSFSEMLSADRSVRGLLRATFVASAVALGLAVQALRGPRLSSEDFLLSYAQSASSSLFLLAIAGAMIAAVLLVWLRVRLKVVT